jgi:predicted transcriptional regulator
MDVSKPFAAISTGVDADVLVVLAGSTKPRSGRELARRAGRSNTGVQHVLDRLVEHGLVNREKVGRTFIYELNRDHLLAPTVEQMAGARAELIHRLRKLIGAWEPAPVHASLFGSAARGDGDTSSDIDLLIVRPADLDPEDAPWRASSSTNSPTWFAAGPATTLASPRSPRANFHGCARTVRLWLRRSARTPSTSPEKTRASSSGGCDGAQAATNPGEPAWQRLGHARSLLKVAEQISPGGKRVASQLRQPIEIMDTAHARAAKRTEWSRPSALGCPPRCRPLGAADAVP